MSDVELEEVDLAKREPLQADRYLLNRMSRTVVHEQVPISLLTVPKWGETMAPPIMVQSVRAKSCPTAKSSSQ